MTPDKDSRNVPKSAWLIAFGILLLDQFVKELIRAFIPEWGRETVIKGFFNIVHVLNKGAAFGMFNSRGSAWQPVFFIAVTCLAVIVIYFLLRQAEQKRPLYIFALSSILGGALGNLTDRLRQGVVIDYLDFYLGRFHWPAFNIADMAITIGAFCLLVDFYKRESNASDTR
ncbi:MAG: signal peptidase II [Desulfohalobiaceae bacterium]|nr:signal peptidase II [Desulfohalobiaceae bacterium]